MKKILLIITVAFMLTGCLPKIELRERAIIQAVGIDYEKEVYTLTFQVFTPESSGQQGLDVSKSNNKIIQSKGESISETMKNATLEHGKKMFLGNNNLIVVGSETAKGGLNHIINYFNSNHDANPKTMIVVSETDAADIVSVQTTQGIVPANAIEMIIERAYKAGGSTKSQLFDVTRTLNNYGESACTAYVRKGRNFSGAEEIVLVGTAIFIDDKMVNAINMKETIGTLWGKGQLKRTTLVVNQEDIGKISLALSDYKRKMKVEIENGVPKYTMNIHAAASIFEAVTENGGVEMGDIAKIKEQAEYKIKSEITNAIDSTLRTDGADLFDFSLYLQKYEKDFWDNNVDNLNEVLKKAIVDINVEIDIDRMGIQSNNNKKTVAGTSLPEAPATKRGEE